MAQHVANCCHEPSKTMGSAAQNPAALMQKLVEAGTAAIGQLVARNGADPNQNCN